MRARQREELAELSAEEKEATVIVEVGLNNLRRETAGVEEEAAERLEAALQVDIEEWGE